MIRRVHDTTGQVPIRPMDMTANRSELRLEVADPEWVAGLLDTMAAGDPDAAAEVLEGLARRLSKAAKAKHALSRVPAAAIRAAFELRASRPGSPSCL